MNRLVIIGNGFDMAHGLRTSYMDFINWYWDQRVYGFIGNTTKVSQDCLCQLVIKETGDFSCWNVFAASNSYFFKDLYQTMKLNIFEYTFDEHDETVAYSLSIPFVSTFVFAAVMKHQEAPGTTFKKHMAIAKGLLSEDDYLLQEILFNPRTPGQVENIRLELKRLLEIITNKDAEGMKKYLTKIREKIK